MSIPHIDPSPAIAERLRTAREHLLTHGLHTANPAVIDEVEWKQDGRCHRLVMKIKQCGHDTPLAPKPAASTSPSAASTDKPPNAQDTLVIPTMAVLSIVGTVSHADFYLTADAGWRGKSDSATTFDQEKATASIGVPNEGAFADDFPISLKTLAAICEKIVTPGCKEQKGIRVGVDGCRIKFRHSLFEVSTC